MLNHVEMQKTEKKNCAIISEEDDGSKMDISVFLEYTECYRKMTEKILMLPYGSISL